MSKFIIKLKDREVGVLLGCLNDASGYPFRGYENGVKENKENFIKLFQKLYRDNSLNPEDVGSAVLALKQSYNHMDQSTLIALHDDVTLEEIKLLLIKLKNINQKKTEISKDVVKNDIEKGGVIR